MTMTHLWSVGYRGNTLGSSGWSFLPNKRQELPEEKAFLCPFPLFLLCMSSHKDGKPTASAVTFTICPFPSLRGAEGKDVKRPESVLHL